VEDEDDNTVLFCYGDPGVCITFIRYARILLGERRKLNCMSTGTVLKSPGDNRQTVRYRRYVLLLLLCDPGGAVRVGYVGFITGTGRWWNREDPGAITASLPTAEKGYR